MADRIYDANPAVEAPTFTRKADGAIGFGKLVEVGTAAGDVKLTAAITAHVLGVAMPDEVIYAKSGTAAYADGDVVKVMAPFPGKILYLYSTTGVAEGGYVSAAAAGIVEPLTPAAGTSYQVFGIALDTIAATSWGRILVV